MTATVHDFPRPMSLMSADQRSPEARLDEALRVNDQLSREIVAIKAEPTALRLGMYYANDAEHRAITAAEFFRTMETLTEVGVMRPSLRPVFEHGRFVGLEMVAAIAPVRSPIGSAA